MAEQLGISEHHFRRLETGRRPMSSVVIAEISRVLTLHPDEQLALYRWAGPPPRPLRAQLRQGALANSALRAIVDRDCEDPQVRGLWHRTADLAATPTAPSGPCT